MSDTLCMPAQTPVSNEPAAMAEQVVALAARLLAQANQSMTRSERAQAGMMARLMDDPAGKLFTLALTDQVFRSHSPARQADEFRQAMASLGVPRYLSAWQRLAMRLASTASHVFPAIVMHAISAQIRAESGRVILPGEDNRLMPYLQRRAQAGFHMNLNQLGEAILGESEAQRRMDAVLARLRSPGVDYISVKISSICSRINVLAPRAMIDAIKSRLRQLYAAAMQNPVTLAGGQSRPRFVNLDMEEYRDLELTLSAFQETLDEPQFKQLSAGIVLQAYLPDSHDAQHRLTEWAMARVASGGAPVKLRLVKGANLAMERVEAEINGWEQAPYSSKAEVDASYKRMMDYALRPEHTRAVRVGIASHNLFDIALAMLLAQRRRVSDSLDLEMLEGMSNHQARAVRQAKGDLLLYAPVVNHEDFHSAIAYLVRRLDENTAPENFLHDLFKLAEGTPQWRAQVERFTAACRQMETISLLPRRTQNRAAEATAAPTADTTAFHNAPNTDWVLSRNVEWIDAIKSRWAERSEQRVPLQIAGQFIERDLAGTGRDPSRPGRKPYRYELADAQDVDRALNAATNAVSSWSGIGVAERARILRAAADRMSRERGQTIACMILDGGKSIPEADPEVSEAIDFARYYAHTAEQWHAEGGAKPLPLGVVVVAPPWNFPYAIPAGGVLAALAMGNAVILKPARETILVAWQLARQLWDAGVPREALQFLVCSDHQVGRQLITNDRVAAVVLTGSWETSQLFLDWKPHLALYGETSGKNAILITAAADRDQAVKDLVHSAFGHAGQKCSAASLAILEAEVYDDPKFLSQLRDAAASLITGSAWDASSQVTPIIREAGDDLRRGLTQLDDGESWLLEPQMVGGNPNCWSPGIRLGVKPGSWYHRTECFGPVLGLIRADNFEHGLSIQNSSAFGLTAGLESLDEREIGAWSDRVESGNAYVNRAITGAIVRRQPFGGWKKSCVGPGAKAGGPNYVAQFARWEETQPLDPRAAESSYARAWAAHFSLEHDPSNLSCESNVFRYRPMREVFLRLDARTTEAELAMAIQAARIAKSALRVSLPASIPALQTMAKNAGCECAVQDAQQAAVDIGVRKPEMLRTFRPAEEPVLRAANTLAVRRVHAPMSSCGRLELTRWLKEQSVSRTMHRHGWIAPRHKR